MLQRLAAWCYRRRRSVVVLWIVALVAVSVIGSNVGSTFSQGFSLTDTESPAPPSCSRRASRPGRATRARSSSRIGWRRQWSARRRGAGSHGGPLRRGRQGAGRDLGASARTPPTAPARSRAAATSRTRPSSSTAPAAKISDATIERIRTLDDDATAVDGVRDRARRAHVPGAGRARPGRAHRHPRRHRHPAGRVRVAPRDGAADPHRAVRHRHRARARAAAQPHDRDARLRHAARVDDRHRRRASTTRCSSSPGTGRGSTKGSGPSTPSSARSTPRAGRWCSPATPSSSRSSACSSWASTS